MDIEEIPKVVTALQRVGPEHGHGIVLLHNTECAAWIWLSGFKQPIKAQTVSVIGFPFQIYSEAKS